MDPESDSLEAAARVLGAALRLPLRLETTQRLKSDRKLVLRCTLKADDPHLPATVIVRRLLPDELAERQGLFYNEWAGLEFLGSLEGGPFSAPRLYAEDAERTLLVLEDLGDTPPLMDVLNKGPARAALAGLTEFLHQLARIHAATHGREAEWARRLKRFGPPTLPADDSRTDLGLMLPAFEAHLDRLGISAPTGLEAEIAEVETAMHEDTPFRAYTHGDAGPHNATAAGDRVFDFEFAGYRCVLLDAAGPRMAFPSAYRGRPLPPDIVDKTEAAYRQTLARHLPQANDDALFHSTLLAACAHWNFVKLMYGLGRFLPPDLTPIDWTDADAQYFGRRSITRFSLFADACRQFNGLPTLYTLTLNLQDRFLQLNPDLTPLPTFKAFA